MKIDCIFCQIANHEIGDLIWENDIAAAFYDIHPKAPTHVLVIAKQHIENLNGTNDEALLGRMLMAVKIVANQVGISDAYRVHINNGAAAGQEVLHLHVHVLGNKPKESMDLEALRDVGL
jgi:histidine triad (HIT) family protein